MDIVPIKVRIGTKPNGHAKYPHFDKLLCVQQSGVSWSSYIDAYGTGWLYDKCCGHKEHTADSPYGFQWGVIGVPEIFAEQALAEPEFDGDVFELDEAELQDFYDNHVGSQLPDEEVDKYRLEVIAAKKAAGLELSADDIEAIDVNNNKPGIRKNHRKTWQRFKDRTGFKVKNTAKKRNNAKT